jgi:hypothetical protein
MNRAQLEHLIRAAATIADDDEIVIVGSQSILGQYPDAPADLLESMEAAPGLCLLEPLQPVPRAGTLP